MALTLPPKKNNKPAVMPANEFEKHLVSKPATAVMKVETKKAGEPWKETLSESSTPATVKMQGDAGFRITVEGSSTMNLGDFNSARVGVSLTVPFGSKEDLEATYDWASEWVGTKIADAMASAKG